MNNVSTALLATILDKGYRFVSYLADDNTRLEWPGIKNYVIQVFKYPVKTNDTVLLASGDTMDEAFVDLSSALADLEVVGKPWDGQERSSVS